MENCRARHGDGERRTGLGIVATDPARSRRSVPPGQNRPGSCESGRNDKADLQAGPEAAVRRQSESEVARIAGQGYRGGNRDYKRVQGSSVRCANRWQGSARIASRAILLGGDTEGDGNDFAKHSAEQRPANRSAETN